MTTNETLAADAVETTETTETTQRGGGQYMSKREAVGRLLEISKIRDLDLDDVVAIQTAVRSLCKRIFDQERHYKRRRERGVAVVDPASGTGAFLTPPEALEAVLANPPTEGATKEGDEGQQADDSKERTGN